MFTPISVMASINQLGIAQTIQDVTKKNNMARDGHFFKVWIQFFRILIILYHILRYFSISLDHQ